MENGEDVQEWRERECMRDGHPTDFRSLSVVCRAAFARCAWVAEKPTEHIVFASSGNAVTACDVSCRFCTMSVDVLQLASVWCVGQTRTRGICTTVKTLSVEWVAGCGMCGGCAGYGVCAECGGCVWRGLRAACSCCAVHSTVLWFCVNTLSLLFVWMLERCRERWAKRLCHGQTP